MLKTSAVVVLGFELTTFRHTWKLDVFTNDLPIEVASHEIPVIGWNFQFDLIWGGLNFT